MSVNYIIEVIFWVSFISIVYSYAIYPIFLFLISACYQAIIDSQYMYVRKERRKARDIESPEIAIVLSAYNEEKHIIDRIKNIFEQIYPTEKLFVYVGTDGCTDKTVEKLHSLTYDNLTIYEYKENRGKVSVLNDLVKEVKQDLILFTDANTYFVDNNIRRMVRYFADQEVGAVCGELNLVKDDGSANDDGLYWKYERFLKFHENRLNALLGANGANYAIRRQLFEPFPEDTIIDDFVSALNIRLKGYRLAYAIDAVAIEDVPFDHKEEYTRRVRIGAGNYQVLFRYFSILNPRYGFLSFSFFSHKLLRWMTPHFMLLMLICSALLAQVALYGYFLFIQAAVYIFVIASEVMKKTDKMPGLPRLVIFFVNMNFALLVGFYRYITNKIDGVWIRTKR